MSELYTIGHSTRGIDELLLLLMQNGITLVVDVRTIPKSRRYPWFNQNELATSLQNVKIDYLHMPELGGLRHPKKDSINTAWRNDSFRGYADYMQTEAFEQAIQQLNKLVADNKRVAIMCAEAVPWRCHRSLIADIETIYKMDVYHIINKNSPHKHEMTSFAMIDKQGKIAKVYYPG